MVAALDSESSTPGVSYCLGTSEFNAGELTCNGLASYPGRSMWPYGLLGWDADSTLFRLCPLCAYVPHQYSRLRL